ncbi:carbamoyltransferase HypF [Pyrobaculum neutrophilum]|uniref:Carbamoyltransferase n=1 Tax=Pyrobaculum neutrophilum (strain DSM 2338 / JCM 9278 / NBRC 100436 / V24Sta) TaxID=444157 RepID=B1YBW1_PYRNV|nr:carbamoyltransferase HypF [Pyrobaculum neutrophilum]ACB39345.1 (NiFe) hydrogenase maturation protein HypF [Pyrobaculum neutrophilum V24Sta]
MPKAYLIHISGIVQGVGFRPYVKILADRLGLGGYVKNLGGGEVEIYVEGERSGEFLDALLNGRPKAIYIEEVKAVEVEPRGARAFVIEKSSEEVQTPSMIPPDLAICEDCLREVLGGGGRRGRYPFNSCSFCGPRFSVIRRLPYDRENTSWSAFPMCEECAREYSSAEVGGVRRFFYQGISCRNDGPRLTLLDSAGRPVEAEDPISEAARLVEEGRIVAVKGVGGFHIFALASDDGVVAELRRRKRRPSQPFAVMALDLETAGRLVVVDGAAAELLTSPRRPVVLLPKRDGSPASPLVSPGLDREGVFLPYTALHYLLLSEIRDRFAIATSGNIHGEPMCTDRRCVLRLGVADYVLDHDLEIVHRVDDSVVRFTAGRPVLLRRGRGYAPVWVKMPLRLGRAAVAFGADLQTAGAVGVGDKAVLTQYIGDLDSFRALEDLDRELRWLAQAYRAEAPALVCDLNPAYSSHRLCREWAGELNAEVYTVQHHHAHALAAAADVGVAEPFLAVAIDGVGLGEDGAAWGGEVLYVEGPRYERVRHLTYVPMPGGDLAAVRPARMALAYLFKHFGEDWGLVERLKLAGRLPGGLAEAQIAAREIKSPRIYTSSVGRFLDAVAAALGVAWERTYEGEPAIRLEAAASGGRLLQLDAEDQVELFGRLVELYLRGADVKDLAYTAQYKLGQILGKWACETAERKGVRHIVVGGGVAVNDYIIAGLESVCGRAALPSKTPPGDGGIALGQLYYLAHLGI